MMYHVWNDLSMEFHRLSVDKYIIHEAKKGHGNMT